MGLNSTPDADRLHIGIFGRRNAGKSSLLNAIAGQPLSIVSEVRGTTTDPVKKAMELLPLGPVVFIDTPGLDDTGVLGGQRIERSRRVLNTADAALVVIDGLDGPAREDLSILDACREKEIPTVVVFNKLDLVRAQKPEQETGLQRTFPDAAWVSASTGENIRLLKDRIAASIPEEAPRRLLGDFIAPSELVVLVVPIDSAAPKGRLILPQQQAVRDLLDTGAMAVVCRESELQATLDSLQKPPRLVVTDSQAFKEVAATVPAAIPLTSFSILMARRKGVLRDAVDGVRAVEKLRDGDRVLISEGCTHHRQCDDIGTVKLPKWIMQYTGVRPRFEFSSGIDFPEDLSPYRLIVHCGGCMLTEREMRRRLRCAHRQSIPMTNYGILIAYLRGILERSLAPLPALE